MELFKSSSAASAAVAAVRAVVSAVALLQVTARAATCPVEVKDKCRCSETGNVTTSSLLDIGCYFKYPYAKLLPASTYQSEQWR